MIPTVIKSCINSYYYSNDYEELSKSFSTAIFIPTVIKSYLIFFQQVIGMCEH